MTFAVTTEGGAINSASLTYPPTDSYRGGTVYVFDRTMGHGVFELVHDNGGIGPTQPIAAAANDEVVVSVQAVEQTVSTCVLLREGAPGGYCN